MFAESQWLFSLSHKNTNFPKILLRMVLATTRGLQLIVAISKHSLQFFLKLVYVMYWWRDLIGRNVSLNFFCILSLSLKLYMYNCEAHALRRKHNTYWTAFSSLSAFFLQFSALPWLLRFTVCHWLLELVFWGEGKQRKARVRNIMKSSKKT